MSIRRAGRAEQGGTLRPARKAVDGSKAATGRGGEGGPLEARYRRAGGLGGPIAGQVARGRLTWGAAPSPEVRRSTKDRSP